MPEAVESGAFFSMLGIAMRAGALTLGETGVLKAIAKGSAALVLVDAGASENTRKMYADSCAYYGARLLFTAPGKLGAAVGKPGRMSAAVAGGPLAGKLAALAGEDGANDGAKKNGQGNRETSGGKARKTGSNSGHNTNQA